MSKRSKRASFYNRRREGRKSKFNLNRLLKLIPSNQKVMAVEASRTVARLCADLIFEDGNISNASTNNNRESIDMRVKKRPGTHRLSDISYEYTSLGPDGLTTVLSGKFS